MAKGKGSGRQDIARRLAMIEGQVRGIKTMARDGKDCEEILIQIKAVQAAIQSTSLLLLYEHMDTCVKDAVEGGKGVEALDDLKDALQKIM
jgi:CsoR family transcriptional regulator, copper-sensing transcriptional repressor